MWKVRSDVLKLSPRLSFRACDMENNVSLYKHMYKVHEPEFSAELLE